MSPVAGYGLVREQQLSPEIFSTELEQIWRRSWLFAAHSADLPETGSRYVFDMADDSVVIVRGEDAVVRAFHNWCRHRGARMVDNPATDEAGGYLRCPYHQWSYRLDGSLAACGQMDKFDGLDMGALGLVPVECLEVGGLVFVRLQASAEGPGALEECFGAALAAQGLARAKMAFSQAYDVAAGWKLIWENNRECWHCYAGHPEYIRSHFDTRNTSLPAVARDLAVRTQQMKLALEALATRATVYPGAGLAPFPAPGVDWAAHRTPLLPGFDTESLDGAPLAPLMGSYETYDVGVLRLRALPNFWAHASADHVVTTRLVPVAPDRTRIVVSWLVDEAAVEGRDYDLAALLAVWQKTSEQDWDLCERNQAGVRSPAYVPGPLSSTEEANVVAFHQWYRGVMGAEEPLGP